MLNFNKVVCVIFNNEVFVGEKYEQRCMVCKP